VLLPGAEQHGTGRVCRVSASVSGIFGHGRRGRDRLATSFIDGLTRHSWLPERFDERMALLSREQCTLIARIIDTVLRHRIYRPVEDELRAPRRGRAGNGVGRYVRGAGWGRLCVAAYPLPQRLGGIRRYPKQQVIGGGVQRLNHANERDNAW
jgi:hypothetical protein